MFVLRPDLWRAVGHPKSLWRRLRLGPSLGPSLRGSDRDRAHRNLEIERKKLRDFRGDTATMVARRAQILLISNTKLEIGAELQHQLKLENLERASLRRIHDMMSHMLLNISSKTSTNWQDIPLIWWFLVPDSTVGCSCHSASMATLKARPDLLAYTDGLYLLGADWSIGQCLGCSRPVFAHLALPWLTVRGEWWSPLLLA